MENAFKIAIIFFLFLAVPSTLAASFTNDAFVKANLQKTIRDKCEEEFLLNTSTTTLTAQRKSQSVSMIALTKFPRDQIEAFVQKGFVTDISQNNLPGPSLLPSYSALDIVLILVECLSPFPVKVYAEPLIQDTLQKYGTDGVDVGLEKDGRAPHNLFYDSLVVKVNASTAPSSLIATCLMMETPPASVMYSSRFTFSLKSVGLGKLDIRPDYLRMRYYTEMASTPNVLKLCAPVLSKNDKSIWQWLYYSQTSSKPKADLPEDEEDALNPWLLVTVNLFVLIFVIYVGVFVKEWSEARKKERKNPQILEMALAEETEEEEDHFILWYNKLCQMKGPRAADAYPLYTIAEEGSLQQEVDKAR